MRRAANSFHAAERQWGKVAVPMVLAVAMVQWIVEGHL